MDALGGEVGVEREERHAEGCGGITTGAGGARRVVVGAC
jgi:hypothetical protein